MDATPPAAEVAPAQALERELALASEDAMVRTCTLELHCQPRLAALIQVSPWLGLGGGWRAGNALATFSAGADATVVVARLFQPPGGDNGGKLRLRLGPWVGLETPLNRWRGEGGLSLALRQERWEAWGSFGIRGGVGTDTHGIKYWVAAASWGIYGEELDDDACWGACDARPPPAKPAAFGVTDGFRFFASLRRELDHPVNEWTFGVEFQPAWFWPLGDGYGYRRWRRH